MILNIFAQIGEVPTIPLLVPLHYFYKIKPPQTVQRLRGCSYEGELARLGRFARLGEISPSLKLL